MDGPSHIISLFVYFLGFDSSMYWIGGNDLATKGRWVWASNGYRIYPYVNWKAAESPEAVEGADGMAMETGIILLLDKLAAVILLIDKVAAIIFLK
jgi:hypothetical protein